MYKILNNTIEMDNYSIQKLKQKSKLPKEYQEVNYIESNGTQYIDTGVNADNNLRVAIDMQYTNTSVLNNTNIGVIANVAGQYLRYHLMIRDNGNFTFYYGTKSNTLNAGDKKRHYFDFNTDTGIVTVDDNEFSIYEVNPFDTELNFWLFGRNSNSSNLVFYDSIKLYKAKMYSNGVLVRDFIPCYRKTDNEVGLYDTVNNVFYVNSGSGDFIYE